MTLNLARFASRSIPSFGSSFAEPPLPPMQASCFRANSTNASACALIERHLSDPRTGRNFQFPLADLFRQSIYSRLAGYEDTNGAE